MHVHLVSPKNPESFWTMDRILPTLGKRCVFPNLALPTLAALTPAPHRVTICDENVEPVDLDVDADVVGITGYIVHRRRVLELAEAFRRRGKRVVVGGPWATLCPEELEGRVDAVFVGEAEETWAGFLEDLERGELRPVYRAERLPDVTESPVPRYELLRLERYRSMPMQFARGCPFRCEFCDVIVMYGRRPRPKSVACAMAEVERLHELGVRQVFVVDDNFIGNRRSAKAFLSELAEWQRPRGHPIAFMTEASVNLARDTELLEALRAANFTSLFVGIESPRRESLDEAGKVQNTRDDLVGSVRTLQRHGFQVDAGMIVGFDADDASVFEEHFRFVEEARIPIAMTGLLNAMPRTPLHERLARDGRLVADSTGDQFAFTNVVPKQMSRLELYRGYARLLERLYEPRAFRRRAMAFLLERGARPRRRPGRQEIRILARFLRDTLRGAGPGTRRLALRMLGETLLRRPGRLPDAVALALMHRHFHGYVSSLREPLARLARQLRDEPERAGLLPPPARAQSA